MMATKLYENLVGGSGTPKKARPDEVEDVERRLARARGKARAEGFAEGVASAEASFDREMQAQIKAVSEALSQFASDREAADATAVDTLRRILAGTIAAFAPSLADAALPELVARKVTEALNTEIGGHVRIDVAPEQLPDLKATLALRDDRVKLNEDQHLQRGSARVSWRGGFDHIDAGAAIRAGADLLDERLRAQVRGGASQSGQGAVAPPPQPTSTRPARDGTANSAKDDNS